MHSKIKQALKEIDAITEKQFSFIKKNCCFFGSRKYFGSRANPNSDYDYILSTSEWLTHYTAFPCIELPAHYDDRVQTGFNSIYMNGPNGETINLIISNNERIIRAWFFAIDMMMKMLSNNMVKQTFLENKQIRVQQFILFKEIYLESE